MPERLTRRRALAAGLSGAAGLAFAPSPAAGADAREGDALTALVQAEQDAVFVHRYAALPRAATLAGQDDEHAKALATHLEALTMPIPAPRRDRAGLGAEALAVLEAPGGEARRQAAIAFERTLI